MSGRGDTWYKRDPRAFLDGVQGMGPELIGAYSVILDILYARNGDMDRDDRHLAGVLGCGLRKARALTDQLIEAGKLGTSGGKLTNNRASILLEERRKQRETSAKGGAAKALNSAKSPQKVREKSVKQSWNNRENDPTSSKNNDLTSTHRIEENRIDSNPIQEEETYEVEDTREDWTPFDVVNGGLA